MIIILVALVIPVAGMAGEALANLMIALVRRAIVAGRRLAKES